MPPSDAKLLENSLCRLARDGFLQFDGEYGNEIATFVPFVAWLEREGHLRGRRIRTYEGMEPYYFFLADGELETRREARRWVPPGERHWPSNSTYQAVLSPWHVIPDFRSHYASSGMQFDRPVVFIQNKFAIEWDVGPVNFLPIRGLYEFVERIGDRFDIVYSRPGSVELARGYSKDHNAPLHYPDREFLDAFPHIHHLEGLCASSGLDYNRTKLEVLAKSRVFVATQGGGSHVLACFGGSLLLMLDRSDVNPPGTGEYPHAYRHGPYKYLSTPPSRLMVATNFRDFLTALSVLGRIRIEEGRFLLPARGMKTIERFIL